MGENHSSLAMSNGNSAYHHVRISLMLQKKECNIKPSLFHIYKH